VQNLMSRIYAPVSYEYVRNVNIVRIVHVEALELAAWFPVVWRLVRGTYELVVVRSLFADGRGHAADSLKSARSLPLLLRAYPFVLAGTQADAGSGEDAEAAVSLDHAVADQPTDAGAPVADADGKLGLGALHRYRALALFAQALPLTQSITRRLADEGRLVPWPLAAASGTSLMAHDALFAVDAAAFESGVLRGTVMEAGVAAALLLSAHRLSLFRAGPLVAVAKKVVREAAP
jgi:hypothetical protein